MIIYPIILKLLYIGVKRVVDLCAAPGSWSQVLSKKLRYCDEAGYYIFIDIACTYGQLVYAMYLQYYIMYLT